MLLTFGVLSVVVIVIIIKGISFSNIPDPNNIQSILDYKQNIIRKKLKG